MGPRRHEVWQHSKTGNRYEVREISAVERALPSRVVTVSYFPLYEMGKQALAFLGVTSFQRPLEEWEEVVTLENGAKVPRFVRVPPDPMLDLQLHAVTS